MTPDAGIESLANSGFQPPISTDFVCPHLGPFYKIAGLLPAYPTSRKSGLILRLRSGQAWGIPKRRAQRTLVFDEIDSGIGGRAAEAVGKKLKSLARSNQVLCVTHLPQIATFADHHYVIEKKESGGRTRTGVRYVAGEERTEEVARMLSGAKLTETSRKHAEQMIKANA